MHGRRGSPSWSVEIKKSRVRRKPEIIKSGNYILHLLRISGSDQKSRIFTACIHLPKFSWLLLSTAPLNRRARDLFDENDPFSVRRGFTLRIQRERREKYRGGQNQFFHFTRDTPPACSCRNLSPTSPDRQAAAPPTGYWFSPNTTP